MPVIKEVLTAKATWGPYINYDRNLRGEDLVIYSNLLETVMSCYLVHKNDVILQSEEQGVKKVNNGGHA